MIKINKERLIELIEKEYEDMIEFRYIDSSTSYLGQVNGIEFVITLTRDEDEFFEANDCTRNPIITEL